MSENHCMGLKSLPKIRVWKHQTFRGNQASIMAQIQKLLTSVGPSPFKEDWGEVENVLWFNKSKFDAVFEHDGCSILPCCEQVPAIVWSISLHSMDGLLITDKLVWAHVKAKNVTLFVGIILTVLSAPFQAKEGEEKRKRKRQRSQEWQRPQQHRTWTLQQQEKEKQRQRQGQGEEVRWRERWYQSKSKVLLSQFESQCWNFAPLISKSHLYNVLHR